MKWYVFPPLLTCGLNSMLAAIVLSLAAFHLYTDNSTNAPIEPNENWICLVKWLSAFSSFWLVLSIAGMYVSMTKKQIWRPTLVLALHAICFGLSAYFVIAFGNQLEVKEVETEVLFKQTINEISKHGGDTTWIPEWLDNVQKQSKVCCGVATFRDYEEFWPSYSSRIPHSCCKNSKTLPGPCPADLSQIPFPHTPGDFVKVEMGCMQEILDSVRCHIRESYENSITMTVFIGCGILAYLVFYVKRYLGASEGMAPIQELKDSAAADSGGGDNRTDEEGANINKNVILENSSGPLRITSSGQIACSMDSFEGIKFFGSVESGPTPVVNQPRQYAPPDQQQLHCQKTIYMSIQQPLQYQGPQQSFQGQQQMPLLQLNQQPQQPTPFQGQQQMPLLQLNQQSQQSQPQQFQQMQQPSGTIPNKTNVVLAGLQQHLQTQQQQQPQQQQQQSPQVDTSMADNSGTNSIGVNNASRAPEQSNNQVPNFSTPRNLLPPMIKPDTVVTDNNVYRTEQQQTHDAVSPPGSPGSGRRKKVRKDALANRNK